MKELWKRFAMPLVLVFIMPVLVNLASCIMLSDHQIHEIPMGVYQGENSALSRNIIEAFDRSNDFNVALYANSPVELEKMIKDGQIAFGLVIPNDFTKQIKRNQSPSLMTMVDGTRLSVASFAKAAASDILLGIKNEYLVDTLNKVDGMTLDEANTLVKSISFETRLLHNPTKNYLSFLLPGMMTSLVQVGIALSAAATEWVGGCPSNRREILKKALAYTVGGSVTALIILLTQVFAFGVPFNGSIIEAAALTLLFTFAVSSMALMISAGISDKVLACQVAAVYFIPSTILAGYTWPISSMPELYHHIAPLLPFTYYGTPLRNIFLKGDTTSIHMDLLALCAFGIIGVFGASGCAHFREYVKKRFASSTIGQRILRSLELKED